MKRKRSANSRSPKKILFVSYFYPPTETAGVPAVQRVVKFIKYLDLAKAYVLTLRSEHYSLSNGDETGIEVPASNEEIVRTDIFDFFSVLVRFRNLFKKEKAEYEKETKRTQSPFYEGGEKSSYQKIKDALSYFIRFPDPCSYWLHPAVYTGIKLIRKHDIDIIFATGQPWTAFVIGFFLKVFTRAKLIIDFRDPWVNNPFHAKNRFEQYLDKLAEKVVVHRSDIVIANTARLQQELAYRYPPKKQAIKHVPNGFEALPARGRLMIANKKLIICHAGFLYSRRDPAPILKAILNIKQKEPVVGNKILFCQIGNIQLQYDLSSFITENGLQDNVKFVQQVPHKRCLELLAESDVLLILQQGTKNQIPSKLYEYFMFNKPIITIAEPDSEIAEIIRKERIGGFFQDMECDRITEHLRQLYRKKQSQGLLHLESKTIQKYKIQNVAGELQKVIDDL